MAAQRIEERIDVGAARAEAPHARVELRVDRDGPPLIARDRRDALDLAGVVDHGGQVVREDLLEALATGTVVAAHDQDRRADARVALLEEGIELRDAQPLRASSLQGARHGGRAVAVAVGLQHGPELGPR